MSVCECFTASQVCGFKQILYTRICVFFFGWVPKVLGRFGTPKRFLGNGNRNHRNPTDTYPCCCMPVCRSMCFLVPAPAHQFSPPDLPHPDPQLCHAPLPASVLSPWHGPGRADRFLLRRNAPFLRSPRSATARLLLGPSSHETQVLLYPVSF